jgi:subtilase family serine protease
LSYFTAPPQNPPAVTGTFLPGVETPASSAYVTAVGGTNLVTTYNPPTLESKYVAENADGDPELPYDPYGVGNLASGGYWGSGGGKSIFFKRPVYQTYVHTGSRARTVPDVSLEMGGCPASISVLPCGPDRSYVYEIFGGNTYGVIGTSVSAPEFAGLFALEVENLGSRLGNANYLIYAQAATQSPALPYFREGIPGFNGYEHTTASGYNMVLGNGTVHAKNFIFAPFVAAAGNPQTPSNP